MFNEHIEIWKPIKGYEGYYEISNKGRVKSLSRKPVNNRPIVESIMKPGFDGSYFGVSLSKNCTSIHRRIHRLVAEAFIPNPNKLPQVNHKDTNKLNNNVSNLEWTDESGNMTHAYLNGLLTIPDNKGEKNPKSKLTESDVISVISLFKAGLSAKQIADQFNISKQTVWDIQSGRTWQHLR